MSAALALPEGGGHGWVRIAAGFRRGHAWTGHLPPVTAWMT